MLASLIRPLGARGQGENRTDRATVTVSSVALEIAAVWAPPPALFAGTIFVRPLDAAQCCLRPLRARLPLKQLASLALGGCEGFVEVVEKVNRLVGE